MQEILPAMNIMYEEYFIGKGNYFYRKKGSVLAAVNTCRLLSLLFAGYIQRTIHRGISTDHGISSQCSNKGSFSLATAGDERNREMFLKYSSDFCEKCFIPYVHGRAKYAN